MSNSILSVSVAALLVLSAYSQPAFAQDTTDDDDTLNNDTPTDDTPTPAVPTDGEKGPSTADPDTKPDAPAPEIPNPAEDMRTYAGVGSEIAYATRGVGEFGGSMSLAVSRGTLNVSADPMLGYFLFDNVRLAGTVGIRHISVEGETSDQYSLMAEPSVHLPFNDGLFWYGGMGAGIAVADTSKSEVLTGFALAPRTGVQLLLGRSGLMNVGGRYSLVFSDVDAAVTPAAGTAVVAFVNTFELQAGYTVMF